MAVYSLVTGDVLVFGQNVDETTSVQILFDLLNLAQTINVVNTNNKLVETLNLTQVVSVNRKVNLTVSSFLPLVTQGVKARELAAAHLLVFTQASFNVNPQNANSFLYLTQTVLCTRSLTNSLSFLQNAVCNIVKQCLIFDQLNLESDTVALIDNNWQILGVFTPTSISLYDPLLLEIPPTQILPVQLVGGPTALTFSNVEYGDQDKIEHTRINRRSRGEDLIIFRDATWPKTEIIKFKLIDLSKIQGKAALDFIYANLANNIKLTDWLGVRWLGVIINPETQLIQTTRDPNGRYDLEIEFQGVQVSYSLDLTTSNILGLYNTLELTFTPTPFSVFVIDESVIVVHQFPILLEDFTYLLMEDNTTLLQEL